jgi:hypothetical protein
MRLIPAKRNGKGAIPMHRLLLVGILLLAGCQSFVGPRQRSMNPQRVDDPSLTLGEQERKSRDQLAFPDGSITVGPRTGAEIPYAAGR